VTIRKRRGGWQVIVYWIERRVASDKPISPDTVEDYRSLIAKKIKPALGSKRLHTVNARVLDAFYDDLRRYGNAKAAARARARARAEAAARGEDPDKAAATARPSASDQRLSANRVRDVHVILSGALGMAARWGWIPFNPALVVRPAGGKGKSRPVPSPEQVRELFAALTNEPDFAVFLRLSTTAGHGEQAVHGVSTPARARLHAVWAAAFHGDPTRRGRRGWDGTRADGPRQPRGHERLHASGQRSRPRGRSVQGRTP
jgi:hypothetical protein